MTSCDSLRPVEECCATDGRDRMSVKVAPGSISEFFVSVISLSASRWLDGGIFLWWRELPCG